MIVTDGLVAGYSARSEPVLRGIDLRVGRGESVAVMGRSGSGKSTLLYALAGILPISSGVVEVAGERVWDLPDRVRTRHRLSRLGFVFQFPEMVPELSLAENVALPLELLGRSRREARARAVSVLESVGIDALTAGRRVGQVSGGQAQRAAVARAIATQPAVVLADEPTGALDSATAAEVLDVVCSAAATAGAALVVVTHDDLVASRMDRVIRLQDGRIVR